MPYKDPEKQKAYMKEYFQRPEVKARAKERRQYPEIVAREREYEQLPEVIARKREHNQRPEVVARVRGRQKQTKLEVLTYYSDGKLECVCCGENIYEFLTIDHIEGGGAEHRRSIGGGGTNFYRWLIKNGFPPGYQVLCYNCNNAKGHFGVCPHKKEEIVDDLIQLGMQCAKDLGCIERASRDLNDLFK